MAEVTTALTDVTNCIDTFIVVRVYVPAVGGTYLFILITLVFAVTTITPLFIYCLHLLALSHCFYSSLSQTSPRTSAYSSLSALHYSYYFR